MSKEKTTAPASTSQTYVDTKLWRIILYCLLPATSNLFMMLFTMHSYIAKGGFGLTMAVAASIASAAKLWDAVTDPIIAVIVPKINTKWGAARPIMIVGFLITAISTVSVLFILPGSGMIPYAICYFGYYLGRTIMNQAKNIASNIITNNPKQRPLIGRCTQIYTMLLGMILSLYRAKILFPKYDNKISFELLQELGLTMTVIGTIFIILACIAISEVDTRENIAAHYRPGLKINIADMIGMFRHNPAFLTCVISDASDKMANEVASASVVTTLLFGILIGNYGFTGDISVITTITTIVLIFFITGMAKRVGAGKAYLLYTKLSCLVVVALFVFMLTGAYKSVSVAMVPTVIFVILYAMLSAAKSATTACVVTMYHDVADYEFYLTGKYMPGLVVATINMAGKIIAALGDLMLGGFLVWMGYKDTVPQQGDPATPKVFWVTMIMWLGMMLLGWLTSIIAMKWYPLSPEKMAEVQAANKVRMAENIAVQKEGASASLDAESAKTSSQSSDDT